MRRRSRFLSLLDTPETRPLREEEADPLRGSDHAAHHELAAPEEDYDPARSHAVCAAVARHLLRDLAPALLLLRGEERQRTQALVAYARTLFDFARDTSLEGERLSQLNRWQFALERALEDDPPGQPIFVQMAACERVRPWPREALDELAVIARARIPRLAPGEPTRIGSTRWSRAAASRRRLAAAGLWALTGDRADEKLAALGEGVLRAHSLLAWHDSLWFQRPELGLGAEDAPSEQFSQRVSQESRAIGALLQEEQECIAVLPRPWRAAARYLVLASARLARLAAAAPDRPQSPRLSVGTRIRFLLQARWGS